MIYYLQPLFGVLSPASTSPGFFVAVLSKLLFATSLCGGRWSNGGISCLIVRLSCVSKYIQAVGKVETENRHL